MFGDELAGEYLENTIIDKLGAEFGERNVMRVSQRFQYLVRGAIPQVDDDFAEQLTRARSALNL